MGKEIHLRISKDLYNKLDIERIENDEEDVQDRIRVILENHYNKNNSFYSKIKNFFKF